MVAVKSLLVLASIAATGDAQLLFFGSAWCEPCQLMQPAVERLVQAGCPVEKIDIDRRTDLATRFRVSRVPSFVLIRNGQVVDRIDGATSHDQLRNMLAKHQIVPVATVRGQSPGRLGQLSSVVLGAISPVRERDSRRGSMPLLENQPPRSVSTAPPAEATSWRDLAVAASVRLRIEDEAGHSYGSGTVIDVHGQDALVLTCAHIFHDSQGRGGIQVDRFDKGAAESASGTVISYDYDQDVALVSMKLSRPMRPARLAGRGFRVAVGDEVFSVGCNHAEPPSVVRGGVNAINKYVRQGNITASGRPVDGRSGGGLFSRDGILIGVCNAADPEVDEGLYAAWTRVHQELDRKGLSFVYQNQPAVTVASDPATMVVASNHSPRGNVSAVRQATVSVPVDGSLDNTPRPLPVTSLGKYELVCVIRSGSNDTQNRVVVVENPTPELLTRLMQEAQRKRP